MPNLKDAVKNFDALVGLSYPTAARWVQASLINAAGGGGPRQEWLIGEKELRELTIIHTLRQAGVSLQTIHRAADTLRAIGANPFSEGEFLAVDHGDEIIRRIDQTEAMATVAKGGQMLLPLPADPVDGGDE